MSTAYATRHSARVAQAQDRIAERMRCTLDEAFAAMNDLARLDDLTVEQVAAAVLHGDIRFD